MFAPQHNSLAGIYMLGICLSRTEQIAWAIWLEPRNRLEAGFTNGYLAKSCEMGQALMSEVDAGGGVKQINDQRI